MRFRGSLILFLLALALVVYYMGVERRRAPAPGASPERLATVRVDAVDRLTIRRPDVVIEFHTVGTHWEMTSPLHDLAREPSIVRLLTLIDAAVVERDLGPQKNLAPFGLDSAVVITVAAPDHPDVVIRVGGYTVDRSFVYGARDSSSDVLLLPTGLSRYASAAVEDYRARRIATFDVSLVDSFDVDTPSRSMRWFRAGNRWDTVAGPDTIRGDTGNVESVLQRMRGLRARAFPPMPRDGVPGAGSPYMIRVYRRSPHPPQYFGFTPDSSGVRVGVWPDDRLVEVDTLAMELFRITVADLRDRHLLHFDPSSATRVELQTPDTLATLVRSGTAWGSPNPALGVFDNSRVHAALTAAAGLQFGRVHAEHAPATPAAEPTFRLAVYGNGGTIVDEMVCYPSPGGGATMATSRSSGVLAEVDPGALRRIEKRFRAIRR